jgi:hypothetical protein
MVEMPHGFGGVITRRKVKPIPRDMITLAASKDASDRAQC